MTTDGRPPVVPEFATLEDRPGLGIVDHVEAVRFELRTPGAVDPTPTSTAPFPYPMDSAVGIRTAAVEIPKLADVLVRDEDGAFVTDYSTADERTTVEAGAYDLDLTTAPLKLHLLVESDLEIARTGDTAVTIDFGDPADVVVGARSFHDRPAGTITVPDDVEAMMDAVSLFGSALKTTSPERSFPTLRGHPPRVKLGDRFAVSKGIDRPETDVTLVVPPERRLLYAMAPLAYYFGAEVVPGKWPRLVAGDYEHSFPRPVGEMGWEREVDDFEREVHRVLRHTFTLDGIVRTEGLYPVDLYEREQFEERALDDHDLADLYELPLAERLAAYLEISTKTVDPLIPDWGLLADVVPTAEHVELLPYLAADLALIRTTPTPEHRYVRPSDDLSIEMHGVQQPQEPPNESNPDVHDMSYAGKSFDPAPTDAIEHAYAGDGFPQNSNKLLQAGFENQFTGPETAGSPVRVHVVSNDPDIADIGLLGSVYGDRNLLDVDVSYDYMVTTDKLEAIIHSPVHLLHFVGEVTDEGFVCTDGVLDRFRVYDHGVQSFFVQHCANYGDLEWLVRRGAYGGVVTTTPIEDIDDSLMMGRWMARLLGQGFTLRSAVNIVDKVYPNRMDYVVHGDGGYAATQPDSYRPNTVEAIENGEDCYEITYRAYPKSSNSCGGVLSIHVADQETRHLTPNELPSKKVSHDELSQFLKLETVPVKIGNKYRWSDDPNIERYL